MIIFVRRRRRKAAYKGKLKYGYALYNLEIMNKRYDLMEGC